MKFRNLLQGVELVVCRLPGLPLKPIENSFSHHLSVEINSEYKSFDTTKNAQQGSFIFLVCIRLRVEILMWFFLLFFIFFIRNLCFAKLE